MGQDSRLQASLQEFSQVAYRDGNANDIGRRSLAVALLHLMQYQDFHAISITELTKTAGVSRMTYYRHYASKLDVLKDYMQQIDKDLPYIDIHQADLGTIYDFLIKLFEYLKKFELSTQILVQQGFEYLILDIFNQSQFIRQFEITAEASRTATNNSNSNSNNNNSQQRYQMVFIAGLLCNTYLYWAKTGQQETPEQLARWIMQSGIGHGLTLITQL